MLDTGSTICLFHASLAEAIGIPWKEGRLVPEIHGIGSKVEGRAVDLRLVLCDAKYSWDTTVVFCDQYMLRYALLGQTGFLEHFEVRLRGPARTFRLFQK
jgi:hypothetical protein